MTGLQLTNAVLAACAPIFVLVLGFVGSKAVGLFNKYVTNTTMHDEITRLVRAAAQLMPDSTAGRLDYVTNLAEKQFPGIDPDLMRAYIESAWHYVKTEFGPTTQGVILPPVETEKTDGAISHNPTPTVAPVPAAPTPEPVVVPAEVTATVPGTPIATIKPGQALFVQTETGAFVQVGHG